MSSLQPSVQPGLPADLGAQACQSDEANFPTEGRHRCARFIPGVRAQRQQREAKEDFTWVGTSPPQRPRGSRAPCPAGCVQGTWNHFPQCCFQCHWGGRLRRQVRA